MAPEEMDKLLLLAIEATTRICSASAVFAEKIALANIAGMLSIYKGDLAPTENARAVAMLFASIIENTKHSKSATSTLTSGGCLATMLAISDVNRDSEELNALNHMKYNSVSSKILSKLNLIKL